MNETSYHKRIEGTGIAVHQDSQYLKKIISGVVTCNSWPHSIIIVNNNHNHQNNILFVYKYEYKFGIQNIRNL